MIIFLAGDYRSGSGPANVTKALLAHLPKETLSLKTVFKPFRLLEIYWKTLKADVILYSGYSRQNVYGMRWAKEWGKPVYYLMHGCVEYENNINGVPNAVMTRVERETLKMADGVLAVSTVFRQWLRRNYPEYWDKFYCLTNGIDWELLEEATGEKRMDFPADPGEADLNTRYSREPGREYRVLSIGGGMPRKQIVKICEAIEKLGGNISLTVLGDKGLDTDKINSYPFVRNLGRVRPEQAVEEMRRADLFVQNSCFETFGLAPLEALLCGCDLLLSQVAGALALFTGVEEDDVIQSYMDVDEIAAKIKKRMYHGNRNRLLAGIDKESTSWKARAVELQKFFEEKVELQQ